MKIQPFEPDYSEETARLFVEVFSENDREWDLQTAKQYIHRNIEANPEYCLVALDDTGQFMGAIFCCEDPYYKSRLLFIDILLVKPEFRQQGVAKMLIKSVGQIAKQNAIKGVHMFVDGRRGFPRSWYEKIGFKETGWVEYEAEFDTLMI